MEEDYSRHLAGYEAYLRRTGRSDRTRVKYVQHLAHFCDWVGGRAPGSLRLADLDCYLADWEQSFRSRCGRHPSKSTTRLHITALKSFFSYLDRGDLLVDAKGRPARNAAMQLEPPRRDQRPIDFLSPAEDAQLLGYRGKPHENLLVDLLRFTGIRVGEAVALTVGDLDLSPARESLRVRVSKTPNGLRTVPIADELLPTLHRWLGEVGGLRAQDPLLITKHGTAMAPQFVWRVVNRVGAHAGVRPVPCTCGISTVYGHGAGCGRGLNGEHRSLVTPHLLRRTFATDLINRDMAIESISRILGHANVAVTQKYYAELGDQRVFNDFHRATGATQTARRIDAARAA